jgi:4'-phosphopantetheinyl transferase
VSSLGFSLSNRSQVPPDNSWLTATERAWFNDQRLPKRVSDWRLGRWTAKRAIQAFVEYQGDTPPSKIEVLAADDGAPTAFGDGKPLPFNLSISHTDDRALCVLAEPEIAIGCDLERIEPRSPAFVDSFFTTMEAATVAAADQTDRDLLTNLIWSAKESTLKALRCGLREDTRSAEVAISFQQRAGWGSFEVTSKRRDEPLLGQWKRMGNLLATVVSQPSATDLIELC